MKVLFSIFLFSLILYANSIDAQIEAIRKAPVQERFKLMNAFKRQIINMQHQERIEAIKKLKFITKSRRSQKVIREVAPKRQKMPFHKERHNNKHVHNTEHTSAHHTKQNRFEHTQSTLEHHIETQAEEKIDAQIDEQIENQTEQSVDDQIENQTENQIEENVDNEIDNQHEDNDDD
ncbi:MAG: hypothetical protein L3J47_08750 [Sulfurovum sp.]|nr:hypothetical protein [Sulfurovum sp.]